MLTWVVFSCGRGVTSVSIHYLVCGWKLWHFRSAEFSFDEAGGQRSKLDSSGWGKVQFIWNVYLSIAPPDRVMKFVLVVFSGRNKKWNTAAEMENKNRIFWRFQQHCRGHLDWNWSHAEGRIWVLWRILRFLQWYLKGDCIMKNSVFWYKKSMKKISHVILNIHFNRARICQVYCNIL